MRKVPKTPVDSIFAAGIGLFPPKLEVFFIQFDKPDIKRILRLVLSASASAAFGLNDLREFVGLLIMTDLFLDHPGEVIYANLVSGLWTAIVVTKSYRQ